MFHSANSNTCFNVVLNRFNCFICFNVQALLFQFNGSERTNYLNYFKLEMHVIFLMKNVIMDTIKSVAVFMSKQMNL